MTATAEEPERLGMCRVCYGGVTTAQERTQDLFGHWYHANCALVEAEERRKGVGDE